MTSKPTNAAIGAEKAGSESIPGLVWAYRFDSEGRPVAIGADETLRIEATGEGFLWLHLNLANQRAREWALSQESIPEAARLTLTGQSEHQQLTHDAAYVWGVIADLIREFAQTSDALGSMRFVIGERVLISARRHPLQGAQSARADVQSGRRFLAPVALFESMVDRVVDAMSTIIETNVRSLDEIEDRVLDSELYDERARLGAIRRESARLHRQLSSMRTIFNRFESLATPTLPNDVRASAARLAQRIAYLHEELHATQERARLLQEEVASQISNETNRNLGLLTVVTTLLLPPTLITGMFGMNVKGLLFGDDERGFIYAILICVASSGLVYLLMRRIGVIR